jgi:hypothetical protein
MVLGLIYGFGYFVGTQCFFHNYDYFLICLEVKEIYFYFLSLCGMT